MHRSLKGQSSALFEPNIPFQYFSTGMLPFCEWNGKGLRMKFLVPWLQRWLSAGPSCSKLPITSQYVRASSLHLHSLHWLLWPAWMSKLKTPPAWISIIYNSWVLQRSYSNNVLYMLGQELISIHLLKESSKTPQCMKLKSLYYSSNQYLLSNSMSDSSSLSCLHDPIQCDLVGVSFYLLSHPLALLA